MLVRYADAQRERNFIIIIIKYTRIFCTLFIHRTVPHTKLFSITVYQKSLVLTVSDRSKVTTRVVAVMPSTASTKRQLI